MADISTGDTQVWFITGASRGLGAAIARAALEAGHSVVAAARSLDTLTGALGGPNERLLPVVLDVTDAAAAERAVQEAVTQFGSIDVLVNNAGYGQFGAFEEVSPEEVQRQFDVNVFGLMHVTRAVLPTLRHQKRGHIFNLSSIGGIRGGDRYSLYAASKFAVEGFSESLSAELAPFGIFVTVVEPGFFRTDFLESTSVQYGTLTVEAYTEGSQASRAFYEDRNGKQAGDPDKLAQALLTLAADPAPPTRFAVGSDAVAVVSQKYADAQADVDKWRALSLSTDFAE